MVQLEKLYNTYYQNGLEILGISFDNNREVFTKYIEQNKIPWPQIFLGDMEKKNQKALRMVTGIPGIPHYFIIDREGNLYTDDAGKKLEELIPKLLESK